MKYIDQSTRDENNEAKRQRIPVPRIAELRHMEVAELCTLMGWPQWEETPAADTDEQSPDYLWAVDRLNEVL